MRLPIRNKSDRPLTVFIEPWCDEFEVPVGGEAVIRLQDGPAHSIEIDDAWVTIWDEGAGATVEVISAHDKKVDDALRLSQSWLHRFGAEAEAEFIGETVERLEPQIGYLNARLQTFRAIHDGMTSVELGRAAAGELLDGDLAECYRVGVIAAQLNQRAREEHSFPEIDAAAPLDTDTVRSAFARALADDC